MLASHNEKHTAQSHLDNGIHSETELDNLQDIRSVASDNSSRMSWPAEGSHNPAFEGDDQRLERGYPLRPGTGAPPHHHQQYDNKRKKKGNVSFDIDIGQGNVSPRHKSTDKSVDPLPEAQTDVPVFSLSPSKQPPARHDSAMSFESYTSQVSDVIPYQDGTHKRSKRRRSSRDRNKKRRHSSKALMSVEEKTELVNVTDRTSSEDFAASPQRYAATRTFPDDSGERERIYEKKPPPAVQSSPSKANLLADSLMQMRSPSVEHGFPHLRSNSVSSVQTHATTGDELGESQSSAKAQTFQRHRSQAMTSNLRKSKTMRRTFQGRIASYVSSLIKQKDCGRFIPLKKDNSEKCCCGRLKWTHNSHSIDTEKHAHLPPDKWKAQEDKCDSFGEIHFQGFGSSTSDSPYVRVSSDTHPSVLWELMIDYWNLPLPRLLISVTGGAQRFEMKDRMRSLLKEGLVGAAVSTGAWIVTGGTATGVMEFVGEAVRDHTTVYGNTGDAQCIALGIATWGIVANQIALDGEGDQGLFPATYAIEDVLRETMVNSSPLDMNHTHFILVDDGTVGNYGREIVFRSRLEKYISDIGTMGVSEQQVISIPAVLIVVEGGAGTMETVVESLKSNTPIVLVKGSGRTADYIALGYEKTQPTSGETSVFSSDFDAEMIAEAKAIFSFKPAKEEEASKTCVKQLRSCLKYRSLVNVFDLENSNTIKDIDRAILCALLRANKSNCSSQLALALAWNRCDIARQQIFTSANRANWKVKDLYNAMFTALVQDRPDFVQLFLDNGVDLQKFLTVGTLWNLYCNCLSVDTDGEASILRHMIILLRQGWGAYLTCRALEGWDQFDKRDILILIGRVISRLMKSEAFMYYQDTDKCRMPDNEDVSPDWKGDIKTLQPLMARLKSSSDRNDSQPMNTTSLSDDSPYDDERPSLQPQKRWNKQRLKMEEKPDFTNPELELFLFSILFNRRQMARVFLKQGRDQIGTALVGCSLLQALSNKADVDEEVSISMDLANHAQHLETFALSVLSQCYQRSKHDAHKLLVRELPHLGWTTLLYLAEQQGHMDFVEHSACQTKLSRIWKGNLITHTSEMKICLTLFIPPLVIFMKFVKPRRGTSEDDDEEEEEEELFTPHQSSSEKNDLNSRLGIGFVPTRPHKKDRTERTRYAEVRMLSCGGDGGAINLFKAFHKFYRAPVTKFYANVVAYLVLLSLFSYFLLTNLHATNVVDSPSNIEIVVWIWFATMTFEEVRQLMIRDQKSLRYKLRSYWSSTWNRFDVLSYTGLIASIIMRFTLDEQDFVHVRIMYSITLSLCFLRVMQFFTASRNMGPKVIMIRRMLVDLMFFFLILLVFVLTFGVAYHINMFPNAPVDWSILFNVLYFPYFQIYGELFIENLKGDEVDDCTRNETIWRLDPMKRCGEKNAFVPVLLAVYMILTNILLVNLLIAMFSYTFQTVQDNSTKVWRFYRISLIFEYFDRPSFVPPAIVLNHIWRCVRYILHKFTRLQVSKRHNLFKVRMSDEDNKRLSLFEKIATDAYLTNSSTKEREKLDTRVASTAERVEMVMGELQRIKETIQQHEKHVSGDVSYTAVTPLVATTPRTPGDTERSAWDSSREKSSSLELQLEKLKKESAQNSEKLEKMSNLLELFLQQQQQQQTVPRPTPLSRQRPLRPMEISDPE